MDVYIHKCVCVVRARARVCVCVCEYEKMIYSKDIFILYMNNMESNALEKSTNNSFATRFFCTNSFDDSTDSQIL